MGSFRSIEGVCLLEEDDMKPKIIALSAAVVMATAPAVFAQAVSSKTPGHEMQQMGSKKGEPGASSYAPGHKMHHANTSKKKLSLLLIRPVGAGMIF